MTGARGVLVALCAASVAVAGQAEWPGWRGPNRDGKSPDSNLLRAWPHGGPALLWTADAIGGGFSSVAVAGGRVYTTGDVDGKLVLFAFDLDGKLEWKVAVDNAFRGDPPGSRATPTIDRGKLYLISGSGRILCCDAANGKEVWASHMRDFGGRAPDWGYAESVLIYKDMAIVKPGGQQGCILALEKNTGTKRWQSTRFTAGAEYSSCIIASFGGRDLVLTGTRAGIVCVDAVDGGLQWSNPWCSGNTANCPTPVMDGAYVFWANGYGTGGICLTMRTVGGRVHPRGPRLRQPRRRLGLPGAEDGRSEMVRARRREGLGVLGGRDALSVQREQGEGGAGHLLARRAGDHGPRRGQGQRSELGAPRGDWRATLPALRHPSLLLRRPRPLIRRRPSRRASRHAASPPRPVLM